MSAILWKDGRLAWTPVLALCLSAAALVMGDYFWRVSDVSGKVIVGGCALVVVGSFIAVIADLGRRKRG